MTRVLISAEVLEEIEEVLLMLDGGGHELIIVAPAPILEELTHPSATLLAAPSAGYGKVVAKLRGIAHLIRTVRRVRPDVVVSGFSMLRHRLASSLGDVPHVSYVRGLMFDARLRSGFSDFLSTGLIGRVLRSRTFRSYEADAVLTVSDINVEFLRARGIDSGKISLCGPVWLEGVAAYGRGPGRVVLCTSALAAHGHVAEHEEQVEGLAAVAKSVQGELVLRVHPRDHYDYQGDARFASIEIDRESPREFLRTLRPDDVLVSQPSTLVYEAGLVGVRSIMFRIGDGLQSDAALAEHDIVVYDLSEVPDRIETESTVAAAFAPIARDRLQQVLISLLGQRADR